MIFDEVRKYAKYIETRWRNNPGSLSKSNMAESLVLAQDKGAQVGLSWYIYLSYFSSTNILNSYLSIVHLYPSPFPSYFITYFSVFEGSII